MSELQPASNSQANDTPNDSAATNKEGGSASPLPPETLDFAHRMFDAAREGNTELLATAIDAGLPVNLTNDKGNTLLMIASYAGRTELTRALLQRKADVNRLNDRGQSPLAGAVFKGEDDVVRALFEAGANPTLGQPTAMETAKMFNKEEYITLFGGARV